MKKILSLIIVMMAIAIPSFAEESNDDSSETIPLDPIETYNGHDGRHRAPMRIDLHAYYNAMSRTIDIFYMGEAEGEVFLYFNGTLVDYSSEINTSFQLSGSGLYQIEVVTSAWTATGSIRI